MEYTEDITKINLNQFNNILVDLSYDALVELKGLITDKLLDIKNQIDNAKITQKITGEYSDPQWWISANYAHKETGKKLFDKCFRKIIKLELGEQQFQIYIDQANVLMEQKTNVHDTRR